MGSNLKLRRTFLFILMGHFFANVLYAAPSTTITTPNSFSPNTAIQSSQVNSDFNHIQSQYNSHTHTDITGFGTVTSGTWNATPIATQYGGTGQDFSATASGALMYFNGTGTLTTLAKPASGSILYLNGLTQAWSTIPQGISGQALISNGASANPAFKSAGKVVQVVNTQTGAMTTGSTIMPLDNTIPQNTEGDQYMSLAITPTSSSNKLRIDVVAYVSNGGASVRQAGALFQDATADALASVATATTSAQVTPLTLTYYMTAGTTSSTTFKFRSGPAGAATTTFNGEGGAALFNGTFSSSMTITELLP